MASNRKVCYVMQGSLAERLRLLRLQRGLTLEGASALIHIDSHTLSRAERGVQKPHAPTLKKIATGYGVSIAELVGEPEAPKAEAPGGSGQPEAPGGEERSTRYLRSFRRQLTRFADRWQREAETQQVYSPDWLLGILGTYVDVADTVEQMRLGRDRSLYATEAEFAEAGKVFEALMRLDGIVREGERRQSEAWREQETELRVQDQLRNRREAAEAAAGATKAAERGRVRAATQDQARDETG